MMNLKMELARSHLVGVLGQAEEFAYVVLYLALEGSSCLVKAALPADGGVRWEFAQGGDICVRASPQETNPDL
jgi:hypothetical protein